MKKLILSFLLGVLSFSGWANDGDKFTTKTIEGIDMTFTVLSETEKTCQVYKGNWDPAINKKTTGEVTIPNEANGYKVVAIGGRAFYECGDLTSVHIPNSVTSIEYRAFDKCFNLANITIPNSVISIKGGPDGAFHTTAWYNNQPDGVVYAGKVAYAYKGAMPTELMLDEGTLGIAFRAFDGTPNFKKLTIPSSVVHVEGPTFNCDIVVCNASTPPASNLDPDYYNEIVLIVPEESINEYKAAKGWSRFNTITTNNIDFTIHPSLGRSNLVYYDYDGDGIMEMFGLKNFSRNPNENNYTLSLMDDEKTIKEYSVINNKVGGGYSYSSMFALLSSISDGNILKYVNGSGQIMLGAYTEDGNMWNYNFKAWNYEPFDIDNDGRMDALTNPQSTYIQDSNGSFLSTEGEILPDSAYNSYLQANDNKGTITALEMNWLVSSSPKIDTSNDIASAIDLNGDGWLDFISQDGVSAYLSMGDKTYSRVWFKGSMYPYDLNGDGVLDYLLYDNGNIYTVLCNEQGKISEKIFSNKNVKKFICRDFDHDGDVDVLAFVVDGSYTYFVFLRNDGNGAFKKKESYVEGAHTFIDCKDYDADGYYEVLIWPNKIIKVNKDFTLTNVSEGLTGDLNGMLMNLGDYDNDGYTDFKLVDGYIHEGSGNTRSNYIYIWRYAPHITGRYSKQTKANTTPKKMEKPVVVWDESTEFLRIIWQRGEDAETSACDLTYEVRIGTAPGKGDVLCVPSLADGRRRVVADGAMGTQLQTLFNIRRHTPGSYYVAVQAVDAGGLGGAWSDETIYEHSYIAPNILVEGAPCTTVDTLTVVADSYDERVTYQWGVTNGEVVAQEKNQAQVTFHAAGEQQVSLTTIFDGVAYQSEPINVKVDAYKDNDKGINMPSKILDINQDGYADGINSNSNGYFVINDGKGNITKYPKSFNADLNLSSPVVLDVNRDGFPDVMSSGGNFLINDGEGEFENEQHEISIQGSTIDKSYLYSGDWVDFTNTGRYDVLTSRFDQLLRTNDYATFNFISNIGVKAVYDINRDGFMDIIAYEKKADDTYYFFAYVNDGVGDFVQVKMLEDSIGGSSYLADINNDGIVDILRGGTTQHISLALTTHYYYEPLRVFLGQQDYTCTLAATIDVSNCDIENLHDYDNNGYLDVVVTDEHKNLSIIYFDHNLQYQIVSSSNKSDTDYPFVVMCDDGYPNKQLSTIKNVAPEAPTRVSVKQTAAGMVINWADAVDDHTPAVQMRYNVSVKRKGKTGENSYVISPMNGGSSKPNLVFPNYYKQTTTMTVPITALTAGETYEVQVQAIDLWNQYSPMSNPVEITINALDSYIDVAAMACLGRETKVKYNGAQQDGLSTNFGEDGKLIKTEGNEYTVVWSSEGVKDITIGNVHSQLIVQHPIDVSFSLPDEIFAGGELPIAVSEEMATSGNKSSFEIESAPDGAKCSIDYQPHNSLAFLNINKPGNYTVTAKNEDPLLNNSFSLSFVAKESIQAEITSVDVLGEHYVINWNTECPASVSKVVIYKEGNSLNNYSVLDTVDIKNGQYVDFTSSPKTVSARYKMACLSDGGQIFETPVHKPLHVMVGISAQGGYSLMWNAYEGLEVDNYRIWRGTSSDNLEVVAQVAGSQLNYTDMNAPSGEVFYAVSFTPVHQTSVKRQSNALATGDDVISNIVSTKSAANIVQATSLSIITLTDDPQLTSETPTLQLYSLLLPTYCTYDRVAWSIVEGEELATISSSGLLKGTGGKGMVKVRVSSLDGSDLTDEISIPVDVQLEEDAIIAINEQATSVVDTRWFTLNGMMLTTRPAKGIFIEAEFLSNGTMNTKKIMLQ